MVGAWEHAPHVAACAGSGPSEAAAAASTAHEYSEQYWTWRGHRVAFTAAGPEDGQAVLMVHGFGASGRHWRRNIPAAAGAGYRVYTLDLLGQVRVWGASVGGFRPWVINVFPTLSTPAPGGEREAPSGLYYGSMGGADFGILGRGHLPASRAGGELCGLACLPDCRSCRSGGGGLGPGPGQRLRGRGGSVQLRWRDEQQGSEVRAPGGGAGGGGGVGALPWACRAGGRGLPPHPHPPTHTPTHPSLALRSDDWRIKLAMPLLMLIDFLLNQPAIARSLFDNFRTKENIRNVLLSVYGNAEAVDDELVELIYRPSCDEGALAAFVSIITGPPGPNPSSLVPRLTQPLLVLWGDADPFTPADGPVGQAFQALPTEVRWGAGGGGWGGRAGIALAAMKALLPPPPPPPSSAATPLLSSFLEWATARMTIRRTSSMRSCCPSWRLRFVAASAASLLDRHPKHQQYPLVWPYVTL